MRCELDEILHIKCLQSRYSVNADYLFNESVQGRPETDIFALKEIFTIILANTFIQISNQETRAVKQFDKGHPAIS